MKIVKIKLNILQKFLGVFFIITMLIGVVGFIGIENSINNNNTLNKIIDNNLKPMNFIIEAKLQLSYHSRTIYRLIIVKDKKEIEQTINIANRRILNVEKQIEYFKKTPLSNDEKKYIDQFDPLWKKYVNFAN